MHSSKQRILDYNVGPSSEVIKQRHFSLVINVRYGTSYLPLVLPGHMRSKSSLTDLDLASICRTHKQYLNDPLSQVDEDLPVATVVEIAEDDNILGERLEAWAISCATIYSAFSQERYRR